MRAVGGNAPSRTPTRGTHTLRTAELACSLRVDVDHVELSRFDVNISGMDGIDITFEDVNDVGGDAPLLDAWYVSAEVGASANLKDMPRVRVDHGRSGPMEVAENIHRIGAHAENNV